METERLRKGYHYSVKDAIAIKIVEVNVGHIHRWAASERIKTFLKEKWSIYEVLLRLEAVLAEKNQARIAL